MNEQTAELIRELAAKLGTTGEHLWGVLVAQAPVSSSVSLLSFTCVAIAIVLAAKWRAKRMSAESDKRYGPWAADEPLSIFSAVGLWIITIITVGIFVDSASMIAAGFFNPEYWALKQIVH